MALVAHGHRRHDEDEFKVQLLRRLSKWSSRQSPSLVTAFILKVARLSCDSKIVRGWLYEAFFENQEDYITGGHSWHSGINFASQWYRMHDNVG
jgi:hypothetical protein